MPAELYFRQAHASALACTHAPICYHSTAGCLDLELKLKYTARYRYQYAQRVLMLGIQLISTVPVSTTKHLVTSVFFEPMASWIMKFRK